MYPFNREELILIQNAVGVHADGRIGRRTIAAMKKYLGRNATSNETDKLLVLTAQQLINERSSKLGKIKVDGYFGPITDYRMGLLVSSTYGKDGLFGTELTLPERPIWTKDLPSNNTNELIAYYGKPGENHTMLHFPYTMYYGEHPVKRTTVNKKALEAFEKLFVTILQIYGHERIKELGLDQYSGCFNNRKVRGGQSLSTHAFAIAMDFDAGHNRFRSPLKDARFGAVEYQEYWNAVYDSGFKSLGLEHDFDVQHIQLTR